MSFYDALLEYAPKHLLSYEDIENPQNIDYNDPIIKWIEDLSDYKNDRHHINMRRYLKASCTSRFIFDLFDDLTGVNLRNDLPEDEIERLYEREMELYREASHELIIVE